MVERSILLWFCFAVASLFAFVQLADNVLEGDTHDFDRYILLSLRSVTNVGDPLGPAWLEEMMRDFAALGSAAVLLLITLAIIGFLVLAQKRQAALLIVASLFGGVVLVYLFKWGFGRPRPDLVSHLSVVYTQSFPSGHAMLSAIVYLTMGVLLARSYADVRLKIYLLAISLTATVLVGVSRVYLGVHWPTDVLAGWAVGMAWAVLCWLVMLWLQSRGRVEPEEDGDRNA